MFTDERPLAYIGRPSDFQVQRERLIRTDVLLIPAIHHRHASDAAAAAEVPTTDWGTG